MASDEAFYEAVVQELKREGPRTGLWAKAYSEAIGNEQAARAIYMKLRVAQLVKEHRKAVEAEERVPRKAISAITDDKQRKIDADSDTAANNRIVIWAGLFFLVAFLLILVVGGIAK